MVGSFTIRVFIVNYGSLGPFGQGEHFSIGAACIISGISAIYSFFRFIYLSSQSAAVEGFVAIFTWH